MLVDNYSTYLLLPSTHRFIS